MTEHGSSTPFDILINEVLRVYVVVFRLQEVTSFLKELFVVFNDFLKVVTRIRQIVKNTDWR